MSKNHLSFGLSLLFCLTCITPMALAQYRNPNNPEGFQNNEQDPSKNSFSGFDPMSLIHNANLSRSRNGSDFAEDTQNNLNKAAEAFKKQQQLQLQQQQEQSNPPTEVPALAQ